MKKNIIHLKDYIKKEENETLSDEDNTEIERIETITKIQQTLWRIHVHHGATCPQCEKPLCSESTMLPPCHFPIFEPATFFHLEMFADIELRKILRILIKNESQLMKIRKTAIERQKWAAVFVLGLFLSFCFLLFRSIL